MCVREIVGALKERSSVPKPGFWRAYVKLMSTFETLRGLWPLSLEVSIYSVPI